MKFRVNKLKQTFMAVAFILPNLMASESSATQSMSVTLLPRATKPDALKPTQVFETFIPGHSWHGFYQRTEQDQDSWVLLNSSTLQVFKLNPRTGAVVARDQLANLPKSPNLIDSLATTRGDFFTAFLHPQTNETSEFEIELHSDLTRSYFAITLDEAPQAMSLAELDREIYLLLLIGTKIEVYKQTTERLALVAETTLRGRATKLETFNVQIKTGEEKLVVLVGNDTTSLVYSFDSQNSKLQTSSSIIRPGFAQVALSTSEFFQNSHVAIAAASFRPSAYKGSLLVKNLNGDDRAYAVGDAKKVSDFSTFKIGRAHYVFFVRDEKNIQIQNESENMILNSRPDVTSLRASSVASLINQDLAALVFAETATGTRVKMLKLNSQR